MDPDALRGKTKYIVVVITFFLTCLFIYQFFLAGWLNEGNPRIIISEINASSLSSDKIVHLSDQEYQDFPGLNAIVENQKMQINTGKMEGDILAAR
ncbi:MAG: hypothetical protein WCH85_10820 [Methanomicrobiales archaeon]